MGQRFGDYKNSSYLCTQKPIIVLVTIKKQFNYGKDNNTGTKVRVHKENERI